VLDLALAQRRASANPRGREDGKRERDPKV